MEINTRILLPFLLFYFLKESSAQTVHNVSTYTSKLMEELECIFTSTFAVQWTEQRDDGLSFRLFLYHVTTGLVQKQTNDSKYDNFNYSIEGTNRFNLVINNVEQDDGGRYLCNPITTDAVTFDVTVEVLPESININCTESNVCMPSAGKKTAPEIACYCTAYGLSSSQLGIQWDAVGINSISNTTFGSSSISSKITLQPPSESFSISCSLTGYRSQIPKRLIRNSITFSPPVCTLTSVCPSNGTNASLTCSCSKGSPVAYGYSFYNSQKSLIETQFKSTLQVNSDKVETSYCKGCNGVFNSQSEPLELNCNGGKEYVAEKDKGEDATSADKLLENGSSLLLWIFIIIGILLLLLVVVVVVKKKIYVVPKPEQGDGENMFPKQRDTVKDEESKSTDDKTTNGEDRQAAPKSTAGTQGDVNTDRNARGGKGNRDRQAAPKSTAGTQGDVNTDRNARGGKGNRDSSSQTNQGEESSVDLSSENHHPEGNPEGSQSPTNNEGSSEDLDSKKPTGAPEIPGKERVTSVHPPKITVLL